MGLDDALQVSDGQVQVVHEDKEQQHLVFGRPGPLYCGLQYCQETLFNRESDWLTFG